ncbi:MAG: MBL fold metallo-hydrolase [Verrucomicrobia bacterium]|nr:MBL fold metallo-hydrolase [Verrucomicrobiota bacterium]
MRITNLNPDTEIGATSWHMDIDGHGLLMDAGMHPGRDGNEAVPLYDRIPADAVDAIAISHCHHDHVGTLPVALRRFPRSHVLMTELSYLLVERVLHNSVNVMVRQRDELGIREYPLFSHDEVDEIASVFQGFRYNRGIEWASHHKRQLGHVSPTLEFYDAGHALGSSGIMVRGKKQTVFFTGDVSFGDQTVLKGARFDDVKADVLVMETTRGNRPVPEGFTRAKEVERLCEALEQVQKRKGCVLIPTFALVRTQEILALLAVMMKSGRLRQQPIYIGGLGRVFTEIYDIECQRTHRSLSHIKLTEALNLVVLEKGQAQKMKLRGGRIFVVTAGMMTEHTAAHDLALRMIEDEKQSIFFVGYAEPSTPGGRLKATQPGKKCLFSASGGEVELKCEINDFDLTAHANREELLSFVDQVSPRTVVLGHGNHDSRAWFAEQIRAKHPKIRVLQPGPGEGVEV